MKNRPLYIQPLIPYDLLQADLTWREKFVYAFISSLALNSYQKYCDATNSYIANELGIEERNLKNIISKLKELGFIEVVYNDKNNQRYITIPEVHRAKRHREEIQEKKKQNRPAPKQEDPQTKELPAEIKEYVNELTKDWNKPGIREQKKQELYEKWFKQDQGFLAAYEDWKKEQEYKKMLEEKEKIVQDLQNKFIGKKFVHENEIFIVKGFEYDEIEQCINMICVGFTQRLIIKVTDPNRVQNFLEEHKAA